MYFTERAAELGELRILQQVTLLQYHVQPGRTEHDGAYKPVVIHGSRDSFSLSTDHATCVTLVVGRYNSLDTLVEELNFQLNVSRIII